MKLRKKHLTKFDYSVRTFFVLSVLLLAFSFLFLSPAVDKLNVQNQTLTAEIASLEQQNATLKAENGTLEQPTETMDK